MSTNIVSEWKYKYNVAVRSDSISFFMYIFIYFLFSPQSFPVMVGDMDNTGSLNAQVIHQLTNRVRSKIAIQVKKKKLYSHVYQLKYQF